MIGLGSNPNGPEPDEWDEVAFLDRMKGWLDSLTAEEFGEIIRDNMDAELENAVFRAARARYLAEGCPL